MGSVNHFQAIKPDTAKLRKLIENSLLSDWAIRIEFEDGKSEDWQQWENSFFALNSAEPVIAAIKECYQDNPYHAIRISAEKFRPQTSMLYTVYEPHRLQDEAIFESQISQLPGAGKPDNISTSTVLVAQS